MAVGIRTNNRGVRPSAFQGERLKEKQKMGDPNFLKTFARLPDSRFRTTPEGLKVAVIKMGSGKQLSNGMRVQVGYTGWLENGKEFDTSTKRSRPFEFTLGEGRVIKGWEQGLAGIQPGERRQLIIPAHLGYGNRSMGNIPANATLVFNVEAVAVEDMQANPNGSMHTVA